MGSGASNNAPSSSSQNAVQPPEPPSASDDVAKVATARDGAALDCYPYAFSPLLLFADGGYFDRGYSNYNAVAKFFEDVVACDMLENVLCDRKNMLYEELLEHVTSHRMLVTCCIDAHFTAFQVLGDDRLLYYDPAKSRLDYVAGDSYKKLVLFLLLKCHYGNAQHIQDNEESYYTSHAASPTRRLIYAIWRDVNKLGGPGALGGLRTRDVPLDLDRWLLCNAASDPTKMSTQETGNTCYFATYLFALLCKAGDVGVDKGANSVAVRDEEGLADASAAVCARLLTFFAEDGADGGRTLRPLTNSNVVLDFYRHESARYFDKCARYLRKRGLPVPDYEGQFARLLAYFAEDRVLHAYAKFSLSGDMASSPNSKSLQAVRGADDALPKLAASHYYKYRAANFMFGFNGAILHRLRSFSQFNALRKNQLLAFYADLKPVIAGAHAASGRCKYRDYYFLAQFEAGQQELVDVHHYTYAIDSFAMLKGSKTSDRALAARVHAVNQRLVGEIFFSTQRQCDYEKMLTTKEFLTSRKYYEPFLDGFMSVDWLAEYAGLGFADVNPGEKDVNSLTQTVFYSSRMMQRQAHRMEYEFEKECINQMARSTLRKYARAFEGGCDPSKACKVTIPVGQGFTYTKYNTLLHFLNVAENYWQNPDVTSVQVFGKDVRALLVVASQKLFFDPGHDFYYYGPIELEGGMDLAVSNSLGDVSPGVSREGRGGARRLVVVDRVFERDYLAGVVGGVMAAAGGKRLKTDDPVINLVLLGLLLDLGLFEAHADLLNLPSLETLPSKCTKSLQVEVSNILHERDKQNAGDAITRSKVEELLFEVAYKFLVNKHFNVRSKEFEVIRALNGDPAYHEYVLLTKVYMSLCAINKSAEVDYYKIRVSGAHRIVIPANFSAATSEYLAAITRRHAFSESEGFVVYDGLRLFDLRAPQPEIHLHKVRVDSATAVESLVKYVEISNVFRASDRRDEFLVFVADNALRVTVGADGRGVAVRINRITVEVATIFLNAAASFLPCFKYADSDDVVLFASKNVHYHVDGGGQFNADYYGMKHDLVECIVSEEVFVDLNDDHVFRKEKLSDLLTESKTILYFPDYLLQVTCRAHLINLLDFAIYVRNVSFFILVLFQLRRASVKLEFEEVERKSKVVKISGPWKAAILYALGKVPNARYDAIFAPQFFDLSRYRDLAIPAFVDELCANFTRYQKFADGRYQIVPTPKQKAFLAKIIAAPECFHFSEVGSGKTKVILPLLCQCFLSNNRAVHAALARGGKAKHALVILVPEHLVPDAKAQVYRYCLGLNFRDEYRVYDDIFALLHDDVTLGGATPAARFSSRPARPLLKQIFITSFNAFKKALTYDAICAKVRPAREGVLVVVDEVDDFLDRDKLVFNICSNKANAFDKPTLERFHAVARAAYDGEAVPAPGAFEGAANPAYWASLKAKFSAVHAEVRDASRSINKAFGIFNAETLRHCRSNVASDLEGYKSLIARPYESVNRAMPGSYYSDVERTAYLTYYCLREDVAKYDGLFAEERKFISYEYFREHVRFLDYDDLVYGHERLSDILAKHPAVTDGLTRFLYEIILRRMEIRDRSRSVNSIDVVFNFDAVGFTGTPFIDNYPTFAYIRSGRDDAIPDLIDRRFYAHAVEDLGAAAFAERFAAFQGNNANVLVEYADSAFVGAAADEAAVLAEILRREGAAGADVPGGGGASAPINALVDLCGVFKRSSIYDVRDALRDAGVGAFEYVYHIDQADGGDRVLSMDSDADVAFDEEFYKYLVAAHGAALRGKVFFFVDNRNVVGKDVPFQLVYQRRFDAPLFTKSVVVAHDVEDFSKIWQAMGRSRTMNETLFTVYSARAGTGAGDNGGHRDIKTFPLTRALYVRNCDARVAGNLSSAYQTLLALCNLSNNSFYHVDEIVNCFLERMRNTLADKVAKHERGVHAAVFGDRAAGAILASLLSSKFSKAAAPSVRKAPASPALAKELLKRVVREKFELSGGAADEYAAFVAFLAGDEDGRSEISYTKQQQKQKQKQSTKQADSDTMDTFHPRHQILLQTETENYFQYARTPATDLAKVALNLPLSRPIFALDYALAGDVRSVRVYPTLQFLYSHYCRPEYVTQAARDELKSASENDAYCAEFLKAIDAQAADPPPPPTPGRRDLAARVTVSHVRQNPQYSLAALEPGRYVIGMKDQFNKWDLAKHPLRDAVAYVADETGFVLADARDRAAPDDVSSFGPYGVEHYVLMEALSKSEVAQNVLDYYANRRADLQRGVAEYAEVQGSRFVCWRFLMRDCAEADATVPMRD